SGLGPVSVTPRVKRAIPTTRKIVPHTSRARDTRERSIDTSDIAATGGTLEDRHAGTTADRTVTPTPTTSAVTIAAAGSDGTPGSTVNSRPTAALRPVASTTPRARPSSEAMSPTRA